MDWRCMLFMLRVAMNAQVSRKFQHHEMFYCASTALSVTSVASILALLDYVIIYFVVRIVIFCQNFIKARGRTIRPILVFFVVGVVAT